MEVFAIPVEDKFILYRPLLQLAFVGNRAMAKLVLNLASQASSSGADAPEEAPEEAMTFLNTIGFLKPDPPQPRPPDPSYRPTTAVLLLTNRCNLRCTYCYASGGEGPIQDLPLELAWAAIDHASQNAVERGQPHFDLTFHGGGEPVQAWETLQQATAYARGKNLPCRISSGQRASGSGFYTTWTVSASRLMEGRRPKTASGRSLPDWGRSRR